MKEKYENGQHQNGSSKTLHVDFMWVRINIDHCRCEPIDFQRQKPEQARDRDEGGTRHDVGDDLLLDAELVSTFYLHAAFVPIFLQQKLTEPNCNYRKAVQNTFLRKAMNEMLMKLTPRFNFTNVFTTAFTRADPQSAK